MPLTALGAIDRLADSNRLVLMLEHHVPIQLSHVAARRAYPPDAGQITAIPTSGQPQLPYFIRVDALAQRGHGSVSFLSSLLRRTSRSLNMRLRSKLSSVVIKARLHTTLFANSRVEPQKEQ